MGKSKRLKNRSKKGTTYVATMLLFAGLSAAGIVYLDSSSSTMKSSRRRQVDVQMTQLCEAAVQACLRTEWRDFKVNQSFLSLDNDNNGAALASPKSVATGTIPGVGRYSAGIVSYGQPSYADSWVRGATVRAVGWIDRDSDGTVDANEAVKVIEVKVEFRLKRSEVFDYTYFVNNFGWMSGFNQDTLVMNGDVRANGDFTFSNGIPTVNGSVIAAANDKIDGSPRGVVNLAPVKDTNAQYIADQAATNNADNQARWRQAYDPAKHGARGSATYNAWKDIIFDSEASVQGGNVEGAKVFDNQGARGWTRANQAAATAFTQLDNVASQEVIMPDLSAIATYQTASQNYIDGKATYTDGTANPFFNQGAWVEVWNSTTNRYDRLGTNGVITGSAILVGTAARPIRIHGPVTVTQDIVIKGTVSGQGTLYAGRNVHIVGSIRYNTKPDFRGSNPTTIDAQNEKADALGLAARGSCMYGNPNTFNSTNFYYMTPPFTKGRLDDNGNWIPAFNAYEVDSSGRMRYQSVIPDGTMNSISEGINQVDAVIYTNFVGGGNVGTGGGGVMLNGSMISRDDALVVYSLPLFENYDPRIKERSSTQRPLIDIVLPRSPALIQSTWQDRGVSYGS